jgi:arginase family enzyme
MIQTASGFGGGVSSPAAPARGPIRMLYKSADSLTMCSMEQTAAALHLDLDGAWGDAANPLPRLDVRTWGPGLRYHATDAGMRQFYEEVVGALPPFVVFGSGDFHHLSASLARRASSTAAEALTLVSFDNHPDWDIRPPKWSCGGWINRALEIDGVSGASVWGCGNFELAFPSRLFGNRRALGSGRLTIHAWAERQSESTRRRFDCMTRADWRERWSEFVGTVRDRCVYVTIDLDCLRAEEAVTNWESGLFTASDVAWAVGELRASAQIVAGDICGAWSAPAYARRFQRLAGWWDHPKLASIDPERARSINAASIQTILPVLTGACTPAKMRD